MGKGISRKKFLKETGVIAAVAAFGGLEAKTALAEQKPTAETDKEKEKYHLPAIEYQDKQLDGFVYQNSRDRTGKIKMESPENGKILFFKESLSKKDNTVLREIDHELHHQNFDQLDTGKQAEIAKLILSKYKIEDLFKNVLNEPPYEMQFEKLQKQYGQQAAEIYAVNEFLGFVMSYADYPPPEVKNPKEHFTEQQWAEFLSEEIKNGGTEETLTRQFKGRPDLIVPSGSAAYDVSDKFFFEMQRSGVLIPDDLKQILEKYGLTPNTFSNLLFHVVFSVKERMRLLNKDTRNRLYPYISGIASKNSFKILCIGGTNDHIHILLSLNPEISISKAVQLIKGNSSKWLRENFTDLNMFSWQEGYSVFTVSKSQVGIIQKYINNQEEHHKKMSFEEEYVELLKRNNIDFNPKYLF